MRSSGNASDFVQKFSEFCLINDCLAGLSVTVLKITDCDRDPSILASLKNVT